MQAETFANVYEKYGVLEAIQELIRSGIYESKFADQKYANINNAHLISLYEEKIPSFANELSCTNRYINGCRQRLIDFRNDDNMKSLISSLSQSEMQALNTALLAMHEKLEYDLVELTKSSLIDETTVKIVKKSNNKYQVRIQISDKGFEFKEIRIDSRKKIGMNDDFLVSICREQEDIRAAIHSVKILMDVYFKE